jgi:hypothetical protein
VTAGPANAGVEALPRAAGLGAAGIGTVKALVLLVITSFAT